MAKGSAMAAKNLKLKKCISAEIAERAAINDISRLNRSRHMVRWQNMPVFGLRHDTFDVSAKIRQLRENATPTA